MRKTAKEQHGVYMEIRRDSYLKKLVSRMWNGQVKVITGLRRSGKSYLLKTIFRRYLLENGASPEEIKKLHHKFTYKHVKGGVILADTDFTIK